MWRAPKPTSEKSASSKAHSANALLDLCPCEVLDRVSGDYLVKEVEGVDSEGRRQ